MIYFPYYFPYVWTSVYGTPSPSEILKNIYFFIPQTSSSNLKSYYTLFLKTGGFWLYFDLYKKNDNSFHLRTWGAFCYDK